MEYKIVLASASPRRRELLSQIGLDFEVYPSRGEEVITKTRPEEIVEELSFQKASMVAKELLKSEKQLIIGSDTIVACDGEIMGKPSDEETACAMLSKLAGRKHQVYTGVTLLWKTAGSQEEGRDSFRTLTFHECTKVEFFSMSQEEIKEYIATGEPMDKAGSYGIQGLGAAYIKGISGDYNNVVGLPIGRLYQEMKKNGLWPKHRSQK